MSFDIDWVEAGERFTVTNTEHQFTAEFEPSQARMSWSAHRADGFRFVSDPASTSTTVFAEAGHVRNGVFFNSSDGDDSDG